MGMFDDLIPKATTPSAPPSTGGMFDDLIPKAPAKPSVLSSSAAAPEAAPAPAPAPRGLGVFDPNENTPQDVGEGVPSTELSITVEAPDGGYWNIPSLWWDNEGKPHKVNEEIAQRLAIVHEMNGGPAFSRFATPEEAAAAARARSDAGGGMARPTPFGVERPETLIDEATQQQPEQPETEDAPRLYGRGASLAGISERNKEASDARAAARTTPNRGGNVEKNVEASDYDPSVFENESLGALWMRRGQQVTRGAAGIAEAALRARSIADVKFETDELRKLGDEIIRASMVIAGDDPQFAKSLSGFEKAQWQSRLARAVAEVARINREGGVKPVEERWGAKAAAGISKYLDETIGAPDPRDQSFWGKLASGLGSMVGFMVPSMIPYVGLPLAAELGASASMDEAYQRAKMAGATEEQALTAASIGKWIGYTEVLPIASILNKVPDPIKARVIGAMGKFVSKHVARAAGKTLAEAIEEGVQEGGQAIYQNLVEKGVYNPETGVWKDVGENALIGFILGGLVSGAVQTVSDSPQTAAARAVADVMSGEPVRMPTPTTSRYISPADDASPIPNDLIESGKQIVEAALRGGPIPPTGGQPPAPLPAGLGTPAVPPEVSTTPPAEAQYEEMDEIETVNGEDRPTGRKVRVDLSTGQAQVLSDPAPAPAAPTIPAAEVIPPEDQGPDTPAELLDDAEKFEQIVKRSKPAGENVPDPETRILKNADFASISTDAETFQYKGGADEEGVTDRLRDVRKWDITRANIGILYEYADGRLVVADGHQRHGLAKRAIADGQDVSWPVLVLREVDGYTPKRARAIAAQKNIAEGTGTAVDAAKVFRDLDMSPADLNLPMSSTLVRNGLDMKHLSEEAFGMVVNEVVAEQHAAIVGRLVKDPKKHADILSLVSRIGPQTQTQAEAIVRQADAEEVTETQTSLFGEETVSANLYEERAKVLDAALRTLGTEIQTFRTLDKRGNRIEEAGNKLRRGENKKILETDAELRAVLMADANRKGETSDALSQAARAVRGGTPVNTAAREFLETVRTGNGASKGNGAQAGNAGLGDGRPSPRAIGRKESDQRRGNEAGQAAGQGDASRSAADAGPERGSAGDGEGSLFAEGPGRPERGSGQPGADATGDARAEAERAADGPATDGPRDQAEAAPSGVIRRGRDEKYGVDVELRKDGEKYVIVQSDPNVPDKAIGASPMGVSVGDYMLNMEGEFVPARSIIQNESRSRTPDKAPFRGDENQRQRVLDLVVEMEFERAVGNSARVDQIESEIARIVAGLEPTQGAKEMRPGQYGSIEKPLRFVSGMSRPGDFTTLLREGQNVGVAINELSRASMPKIADELVKSGSGWLFVDSGAFSLFRANQIAEEQGNPPLFPDAKVDGKELNVERLFAQYNALAEAIGNKAAGDDRPQARVYYVLPDVVADQDATLAYLNSTYSQQIKDLADFSNAIMPLQGGDMSLAEFYEEAMRSFGHNPDTDLAPFIVGLPSRAAAVENAQVVDLLNKHGDRIEAIHILGAASDAAMKPRLDAMREAGWDGNVSSDGNRLRSFLNSSEDRAEAMRRLISEEVSRGKVGISKAETEGPTTTQRNPRKMLAPTDTKSEGELPAGVVKRFNERAKSRAAENRAKLPPEMTAILAEADEVDVNLGDAIAAGMVNAASAGQTYDQNFARELIKKRANVMVAGKYPVEPRIWDSLDEIAEGDQEARALRTLDRPIMDAITKRLNEEQKKLAAMGFRRPADLQGGGTAEARAQAQKISFITGSAVRFAKQVRGWRSGWKNYPREKVDIARAQLEELVGPLPELQEGISVDPSTLAPTTGGSQEDMFAAPVKQRPKIADDVSAEEIEAELASMDVDLDELRSQQEAATEAPKAQMTGEETGSLSADEAAQAVREWLAAGRPPTGGGARVNGKLVTLSFGQWWGRNRVKTPGDKVFVNASDAPDAFYFPISAFPAPADGSLAVEATPEGQQSLIPGVAPITQRDRQQAEIEARRNAKLTGTDRGAKERDDLFGDPNARNDLFDTPAAPVAERAPQGIKITALQRGIDGTYRATDANGKLAGTLNVSPRAAYASSVMVEAGFQRKGVASALYAAAEADLGRKMMPSPLGLSADGIAFWKARLAKMPEAEAQALLSEMVKVGQDAGVGKSAEQRAGWLGYKQPLPDIWIEPAPENADITRRVFRRDGDGYEWASYSDYQANGDRARWFGYASKELPASIRGGENVKPADQPTNASDQPTNNLADGEPAETYTVYKGAGRADKNSVYNSVAAPILGEGSYYAFDKKDAEFYGPEVTSAVVRGRFYEVTNDVEWRALTKAVGWKYPNPYGLSKEEVARDTEALREYIIKQGYDGVKVEFDKNGPEVNVSTGHSFKLLMNVFSVPQIVQYTTAKASPKADPMAAFAEAKAAFAEADATKKIANPQKFFDLSAALGKARDAAADHLAARDEGGVVLRNASSTLGAMITKNTTGADPWRITYFDGRGFSGDRAFKDKSAAVRDAMREGYDTEDRDFLRKLRSGWDKAEPPASFDARPSEAKQGEVGMMLAEGEVVRTTTGRLTTPFPKIAGDSERKALNTEKRVETWLMVNAFEEATARGDEFNARVFEANIKKPSQSDKDSAEAYLFDPAFNQPVRQSILKPLSTPEAIKGTASVGQRMANARQSFIDAAVEQFGVTADQAARAADAYSRLKLVKFDPVDGQFHLKIGEAWERAAILGAAGEAATAPTTAEGTETARTPDTATSGALRAAMEAGEVEHVTKKGKTLTGYVVAGLDKAAAQQIDRFTFKKDGGFYVREAAAEKYLSGETEADTIAAENKERFTPVVTRDRVEVSGLENDGSNWLSYYEMDGRLYGAVYAYGKTSAWEQSRREGLSYGDPMNTVPAPRDFNGRRAQKISIAKVAKLHTERVEADQAFIDRHDELVGDFLRQQAPAAPGPDTDRFLAREQARGKIVTTPSNKKIAAKLRAVGESALAKGEEKFGQTRNTNTARRARMAAGAEAEAQTMIRRAKTAIAIADLIEAGEAGPLVGVTSMADVEALDNAIRGAQVQAARNLDSNSQAYRDKMGRDVPIEESDIDYMRPPAVQAWPKDIAGLLEGIGKARLADRARIKRIASHPENFSVTNTDDVAALADLVKVARAKGLGSNYAVKHLAEAVREFNRWKNMGATTQDERIALAKAYLNARRGQKAPTVDPMVEARRKLIGSKIPGFFETPEHIAARMVEEAGLMPGEKVLEPSAGAGRIAVAAAKIVGKENVDVIEINTTLQELLRTQGFDPVSSDFTGYAGGPEGGYDVILMNPPFEQRQDAEHVRRAFDLLRPGGRLVSIMGEGVFFGSDKKATEFREWIESLGAEGERLPAGTFEESGTGTNTRIIRINKPGSASQAQVGNSQVGNSEADTAPAITTPQEQAKPEPTTEMGTPTDLLGEVERTEAASSKIEDFGEKIEGARKDVWQDYADRLDGVADEDIATAPFAKVWPPADYQALIDGGADPWTVGFIRVARDLVPAKPRKNWKLKGWVKQVTILRQFAGDLLTGETSKERVIELLDRQEFRNLKRDLLGPIDLYMAVGHSKSIKGLTISAASYSMRNGITYNPAKVVWEVQQKQKATAFSNMPRVIAEGETRDAAIASFKEKFSSLDEPGKTARNVRFEIYSRPGQDGYFVGKKMGRNAVDLARFDTVAEARDYRNNHLDELVEKWKGITDIRERRGTNLARVGQDYRNGADVTPEQFSEAFGFRGVQFGNYVEGARRQQDLNEAYDGLLDLSGILGVDPRALSLNGELGLAFGARGTGGKNAAKAHYEPDQIVINLTKRAGAGSLAHEWFHGVDNYFERMRGRKIGYITDTPSTIEGRENNPRPEVLEAFQELKKAINKTGVQVRSRKLDQYRSNPYWATGIEMAARSFESYVIAKLQDQGYSNDYLANIVDEAMFEAEAALSGREPGGYPYPKASEVPIIREGFDNLFNVIQTKETERGVAMFSISRPADMRSMFAIDVHHGSGADFEQFSLDFIGTGEGAQMMGWGAYFGENPRVAGTYQKKLSGPDNVSADEEAIAKYQTEWDALVAEQRELRSGMSAGAQAIANLGGPPGGYDTTFDAKRADRLQFIRYRLDALNDLMIEDTIARKPWLKTGRMYNVRLHVEADEVLDLDATMGGQSEGVKAAMRKIAGDFLEGTDRATVARQIKEKLPPIIASLKAAAGEQTALMRGHPDFGLEKTPEGAPTAETEVSARLWKKGGSVDQMREHAARADRLRRLAEELEFSATKIAEASGNDLWKVSPSGQTESVTATEADEIFRAESREVEALLNSSLVFFEARGEVGPGRAGGAVADAGGAATARDLRSTLRRASMIEVSADKLRQVRDERKVTDAGTRKRTIKLFKDAIEDARPTLERLRKKIEQTGGEGSNVTDYDRRALAHTRLSEAIEAMQNNDPNWIELAYTAKQNDIANFSIVGELGYLNQLYDPTQGFLDGREFYDLIERIVGSPKDASMHLFGYGIRGSRFLDGFSRSDGEGTRNYVIWDEAVIEVMAKFQRAAAAEGITGWHGSAADFNRFDLGYLGTGEGAQMVGHGHYLAGVEATGKFYQETLTARGLIEARNVRRPEGISDADFRAVRDQLASFWGMWSGPAEIMQAIQRNASELTAAREYLAHLQKVRAEIKEGQPDLYKEFFEGRPDENLDRALASLAYAERAQRAVEVIEEFGGIDAFKHPGRLYRVRIMASEAEFLDWDRPLTEQPEHIVEAVADLAAEYGAGIGYSASGEVAYEAISRAMMSDPNGSMQQAHKLASEALFAKGIAGIKFKDAMSRGSADGGTNNYVVFDDSLLSILDKYQASGAQPGSVMYETRPEQREAVERMVVGIKRRLDQRGIGNIPVAAAEKMFGITPDGDKVRIDGAFVRGVVGVALNPDARGLDGYPGVEHTVDHETIHALRDPEIWGKSRPFGLFRAAEWMLLQKAALADTKRMAEVEKHYPLSQGWTRDNQIEEAIADMYADWQAGRMEVKGLIRSAFERIRDFIAAIRAVLRGEGFNTVDAIFRRVERGAVGRRQGPGSPMSQGAVKGWPETSELTGAYRTPMYAISPRRRGRGAAGPLFQHNRTLTVPDRTIWDELTNHNRSLFANIRAAATGGASDTLDRFRWHLQDQFLPVMRAQEAIAAQGYVIDERENPYLKEEMMHGRVGRHLFEIDEEYTKPIVDLMAEHDLTVDQVDEYLYARHAEERNDRIASINPAMPDGGSGMDTADARQILAAVAAGPKARAYSQIGALIDRLRERTIRVRQDAGLLTAQEAAMWRRQYRHYVPLKGFVEDAADMRPSGIGKKFNVSGPESKRALGRRSEAFSPLQNALTQAQEVAIRAEKNRIGVALYNLVLNHPSPMWDIRTPEMKRFFNRTTGLVESRAVSPTLYRPSVDELALKVNGKEVRIKFNDPRLARAVGTLDAPTVGGIIRAGMSFSRYFSAVNTMMNPSFLVSNAFRDMQTAQINIQGFGEADAKAISKAMIKNWGRAFRAAYLGQVGVANDQWTRYYREYEQTGAKVAFWRLDMPAEARSDLEARLRIAKGGALTKVGQLLTPNTRDNPVLGFIERVNLSVDNAIRLAAYVEARRAGWSKEAAASLSKNLTVNFNRRGAMSPALNALYPFFNAALQGQHVMLWAMKFKPVRRVVAGIIAAGFLEDQINSWLSAEDDDDELAYDKVPDWRMRRYISLMFPDQENPVSFMMPYGYSVFSYAGKQLSKVTRGVKKPGDALVDFLAAAFEGFSPINGQTFLQVITPTFLEPIIEVTYNNNWLGNKIRPEYEFNDYGPQAYKYFSGVSDASRVASDIMNQVTGGSRVESGLLDISPEYIDHMAGWATGGMGRFAGRVSDLGVKMAFGEFDEIEVGKIPFARQLYFETGDWLDSDRYYRFRDEVREAKEAVKEAREMGSLPSSETLKKARLDGKLNDVEKKVSALRKKIRVIQANESLTEAQRRDKLKPLRERQNHYMLRFNKAYVGAMGPQGE